MDDCWDLTAWKDQRVFSLHLPKEKLPNVFSSRPLNSSNTVGGKKATTLYSVSCLLPCASYVHLENNLIQSVDRADSSVTETAPTCLHKTDIYNESVFVSSAPRPTLSPSPTCTQLTATTELSDCRCIERRFIDRRAQTHHNPD